MVTALLDGRQTGYVVSDKRMTRFLDRMPSRRAGAPGRVPPFVRSGGLRPWTRFAALALLLTAALVASSAARADDPASLRSEAEQLRAQTTGLAAQAHTVLLELYALETRLAGAEARLAALRSKQARLEDEEASARRQLEIARRSLHSAERGLARRLQTLYVEGEVDPLAVLLGAESLDEALSALDGLGRMADLDVSILAQVRRARGQHRRSLKVLEARQAELEEVVDAAAAERAALAGARAERAAYLADLERRQALNAAAIGRLTSQAAAAEQRGAVESSGPAPTPVSAPAPAPAPAPTGPPAPGTRMTVSSTGYCLRGRTSTGIPTGWGVVAVDPAVIPLGTRMTIPGYGDGVAADTGSAVRGAMIDVWFPTCSQALAWGRKTVTITIH
jgi:3D (Asp-Asp-Asp) domain-containing protein/peptidoglycan hydrolase CwlO-like protein